MRGILQINLPRFGILTSIRPSGPLSDSYHYGVIYLDEDGDTAAIHSVYIDDVQHDMTEDPYSPGDYYYDTPLSLGTHSFRFYFIDSRGETVSEPARGHVQRAHREPQPISSGSRPGRRGNSCPSWEQPIHTSLQRRLFGRP